MPEVSDTQAFLDPDASREYRAHDIAVETMGPVSLSARTIAERMRQALVRPGDEDQPDQPGD